jgi:hypothetical protein
MTKFDHVALNIKPADKVIFTAMSKKNFYMRMLISKFVLDQGEVPINPFMSFDYFLADIVDRDIVRRANNTLVDRADELWTFGDISDGVKAEVIQAQNRKIPIKYFKIEKDKIITEVTVDQLVYEEDVTPIN